MMSRSTACAENSRPTATASAAWWRPSLPVRNSSAAAIKAGVGSSSTHPIAQPPLRAATVDCQVARMRLEDLSEFAFVIIVLDDLMRRTVLEAANLVGIFATRPTHQFTTHAGHIH